MAKTARKKTIRRSASGRRLDYKEVMLQAMAFGHDAVRKMLDAGEVTIEMVQRAAEELLSFDKEKGALLAAFAKTLKPETAGRGRVGPQIGEERVYRAQTLSEEETEGLFIRLPVGHVVRKKGDGVAVKFDNGHLVVTAAEPAKARARG